MSIAPTLDSLFYHFRYQTNTFFTLTITTRVLEQNFSSNDH